MIKVAAQEAFTEHLCIPAGTVLGSAYTEMWKMYIVPALD